MQSLRALVLTIMSLAPVIVLGCDSPVAPSKTPDGQVVSEREMIASMDTLRRFNTDTSNFVKCLQFEAKQKRLTEDALIARQNEAVTKLNLIASRFNDQLRVFKAVHGLAAK